MGHLGGTAAGRKFHFLVIECGIYIVGISLFGYLMSDTWTKYKKKSSTMTTSFIGEENALWTLPYLTFCPSSGFKTQKFIRTQEEFEQEAFGLTDIFENMKQLNDNFDVGQLDTLINGRCFTLTDKKRRPARDFTIVNLKKDVDLELYIHETMDELVTFIYFFIVVI